MADLVLRPAEPDDAAELEANLRESDRDEIIAASGPDTRATVERSFAASVHAYTYRKTTGELLCSFGVAPFDLLHTAGAPWMLGTPVLDLYPRTLVRVTRRYFDAMLSEFSLLVNHVDARNAPSIRLIRAAGCTIDPPAPFGHAGLPFHRFYKERG